jgi:hypothetical protein
MFMIRTFLIILGLVFCFDSFAQKRTPVAKKKLQTTSVVKRSATSLEGTSEQAQIQLDKDLQKANEERAKKNSLCYFDFSDGSFKSKQNPTNDFVVYEIPDMKVAELKAAVYTALSSMFKSPKDVISNLSDNMLQLEGYASDVYSTKAGDYWYSHDLVFDLVIQFKDGKVRYNIPTIKMIYAEWPLPGMAKLDMSKPLDELISEDDSRIRVGAYFESLIKHINLSLQSSNNW